MKYTSRDYTPLKYHSFFRYAGLPLGIIFSIYTLFTVFQGFVRLNGYFILVLLITAADIVLSIIVFIGFFKWKPYAWYSVMALMAVRFIYNLTALLIYSWFASKLPGLGGAGAQIFVGMIGMCLVAYYYYKRRLLFFEDRRLQYIEQQTPPSYAAAPMAAAPPKTNTEMILCTACGAANKTLRMTCYKCGAVLNASKKDEDAGSGENANGESANTENANVADDETYLEEKDG